MCIHIQICAHQFFYGFNIAQKLETSPHENQNPTTMDDFSKIKLKVFDFKARIGAKF